VREPSKVSVVGPDGGKQIHLGPVRMRILEDGGSTGHRLGISGSVLPPHTPGPPQHRHARHDEGFYIVCGTAVFTVGDTDYEAPPQPWSWSRPAHRIVSPTRAMSRRHDQHFHPRPVRSVLQGHERIPPERRAMTPLTHIAPMRRCATEPATEYG